MNYRHAYHAGNFADVVKHVVLARIIVHLCAKPAAFRVIDTHAGAGVYDLAGLEASATGEWRDGIARVIDASFAAEITSLLAPYRNAVAGFNRVGELAVYPGSPALILHLLRPQDRLVACELEETAARALLGRLRGDDRVRVVAIDGWTALNAYVPPKERRGLVLIDPPFEDKDEFARMAAALAGAHRKWPTGIYALWYPIKDRAEPDAFARRLARLGIPKILRAELNVAPATDPTRLNGSGLIIVNPPWPLERELRQLLPTLAATLARAGKGGVRIDWLAGEK